MLFTNSCVTLLQLVSNTFHPRTNDSNIDSRQFLRNPNPLRNNSIEIENPSFVQYFFTLFNIFIFSFFFDTFLIKKTFLEHYLLRKMSEIDELYELRNNFYLGHFATAVIEANKLKLCKRILIITFS